ncbi:unnamed protein product [Pseudo-nitzschia multistriata]|uniref:HhH-GPD domain-containing protein n=1 Tax=Pseudo-nitzschia multistriata TaxID=183589 RepID=A0A448Z467_9STRA|nr:unnamed protein product [Pseudo-nitzschia multistriata]
MATNPPPNDNSGCSGMQQRRRSTRNRTRPVLFGNTDSSSPQRDTTPTNGSNNASLVSPDPVGSSPGTKSARNPRGRTTGRRGHVREASPVPDAHASKADTVLPDRPVSSTRVSSFVAPDAVTSLAEATILAKAAAAALLAECGSNKRKRVAPRVVRPTTEECEFAVSELGKLHPDVIEKCLEIRRRTTVTTNVASDCEIDKDIREPKREGSGSRSSSSDDNNNNDDDAALQPSACGHQPSIMDGVVSTMLSQNTTASNSTRAFGNLKKAVPDWNAVADDFGEYQGVIERAIHCGGLAQRKAANIIAMCRTLHEEKGAVSLEYLRDESNESIQNDLLRFKGLGPKTISCVLLFTLGRADFPVDTHVFRITKQHGWLPREANNRERAYDYLNGVVPDHLKLELHCLLVQHGRECHRCAARGKPQFPPRDGTKMECPLVHLDAIAKAAAARTAVGGGSKAAAKAARVKTES